MGTWPARELCRRGSLTARVAIAVAATLVTASCSGSSDSATQTTPAPSTTERGRSVETTSSDAEADGEQCGKAPKVADADQINYEVLDEASLRGTPAEVRLPSEAGFPTAVIGVADGAILLEETTEIDRTQSSGDGAMYTRADLVLRRLDGAGSTLWTLGLGTFVNLYRTNQDPSLVLDGDLVRVLWPRYDGTLPARLYTRVPATFVLSAVRTDGTLESEIELDALPASDAPPTDAVVVTALGVDGTAAVGEVTDDDFVIESYTPTGESMWHHNLGAPPLGSIPQLAVLADSQIAAASGGQLVRWDEDGRRQWTLALDPTSMAPIRSDSPSVGASADLLLGFSRDDTTWFCALDRDGRIAMRTAEARRAWGEVERAWGTASGLMVLSTFVATGANTNLTTFDPKGTVVRDVQVAGSGDVIPAPGSAVPDAAVTEGGDLLLAAAITSAPPGLNVNYDSLESWEALIRLPPPAGDGDLSQLPIMGP